MTQVLRTCATHVDIGAAYKKMIRCLDAKMCRDLFKHGAFFEYKCATSLRENLDLSHVVLLKTLKIFVAI